MIDINLLVLEKAVAWHNAGLPVWLVTVARTWGSSPRPPGSIMAINGQGQVAGSVSGGCIEDDLLDRIREGRLQACPGGAPTEVVRYGVQADDAHRFGLPCGGTIELVLECVGPQSQLPALLEGCRQRRCLERHLDLETGHAMLQDGPPDGMPQLTRSALVSHFGPTARLIVIGAGDTSRFLCQIALTLGFEIIVCDPRDAHDDTWRPEGIAYTREMPDDLILRLQPDRRTAVVALTHDPKLDDLALIDAVQSDAFYIGAIGSRRNSQHRRERLREHFGMTDADLARLRGPAGIYIGSKTPAEIALSIMAEVVAAKNGAERSGLENVADGKARVHHAGHADTLTQDSVCGL
ncbi:putative xanthine dehydrogenase subunit A [Achromobacter deleyi]|uniref:Putative xanthine dehydrogenase subunit A n=1 Tax=Achromobacter deleyi TaxID=1353891 RepID=A0A6S7AKI7_9BURK|nr:XdhC family protein [Achromobacter deleyi]CAB3674151.1 putative xanthine dehydrogenase subunit A [Achromobacter deleyi]CAB3836672.1 putative xanthine dehydrogenase subunit A [Achromobacter deleyi]CAB3843295.1 putative xanthine dehydrogenase subunit A [Achromobacter deleyi]